MKPKDTHLLEAFLVVDSHSCFLITVASNGNKGPGEAGPARKQSH